MSKKRSFDSAMELQAAKAGLVSRPAFKENRNDFQGIDPKEVLTQMGPILQSWGEPPPTKNSNVPIYQLVMADVMARTDFGIKKYGTPLQANNGRNPLKDAYEEALDLCMYLRQALEEQKK